MLALLPVLAIAAVIEAEVMLPPFAKAKIDEPSIKGTIKLNPDLSAIELNIILDGRIQNIAAPIEFNTTSDSITPYFSCPVCDRRCLKLIIGDQPMCAVDYLEADNGLRKSERRQLLRDANERLKAIERIKHKRWLEYDRYKRGERYRNRYEAAIAAGCKTSAEQPSDIAITKPIEVESSFSTSRAILLGRDMGQNDQFEEYGRDSEAFLGRYRRIASDIRSPENTACVDAMPCLDIASLRSHGWFDRKALSAQTLRWPDQKSDPMIIVDCRDEQPGLIVVIRDGPDDVRWQFINTWRKSNNRLVFLCPVRDRGCDKLYFRNGYLASREAHRLYHPSQRGAARPRARKKETSPPDRVSGMMARAETLSAEKQQVFAAAIQQMLEDRED